MKKLKLGIPKGSLEAATVDLFRKSGWRIRGTDRSYFPSIDDETLRISLIRAQEMSRYVESGTLDAGITGNDWIQENESDVQVVAELVYAKASFKPVRWVLAVSQDSPITKIEDLKGKKIATEMVNFTQRFFSEKKIPVEVEFSWGATEAKAAEGLVDAIVEVTETGRTIRAHGLRILQDLLESSPQLIANKTACRDSWKWAKIKQIRLLLQGALAAENKVGIKLNVVEHNLDNIIRLLPSITAPTVSPLYATASLQGKKWYSVESVIPEDVVRDMIPNLIENGAVGIVEYPLNKVI